MDRNKNTLVVFAALATAACASPQVQPSGISLEAAMTSVGKSLIALRDELRCGHAPDGQKEDCKLNDKNTEPWAFKTGMIPAEVEVTFDVAAGSEDKKGIDLSIAKGIANAGLNWSATSSYNRSNQITVRMVNILALKSNTISANYSPEQLLCLQHYLFADTNAANNKDSSIAKCWELGWQRMMTQGSGDSPLGSIMDGAPKPVSTPSAPGGAGLSPTKKLPRE